MRRSLRHPVVALALFAALGCQNYNFNPVKQCLLQPGTERVKLSNVSSADVLFVVDDSGSMAGEQQKLATAFDAFITSLHDYNDRRAGLNLEPFDFHLALTTTSVFLNRPSGTCEASCGSASNVCCLNGTDPMLVAKACPAGTGCGAGFSCKTTCQGHGDEKICCDAAGTNIEKTTVGCTAPGEPCGEIQNRYAFPRQPKACASGCSGGATCVTPGAGEIGCGGYSGEMCCTVRTCAQGCAQGFSCGSCGGLSNVCCASQSPTYPQGQPELVLACTPEYAQEGDLFPRGKFVGLGTNPRVLHFDKSLYGVETGGTWNPVPDPDLSTNGQGFTRQDLGTFFGLNVKVGTCGSGQEQGLQAARLAISKALSGKQLDVVNGSGDVVSGGVPADWPHAGAKLVVVYVGDEDDCSSPEDPFRGVVLSGPAGNDTCVNDTLNKQFRVEDVVQDLEALGRPVGAAFVVSASRTTCVDDTCQPGLCCDYQCTALQGAPGTCRTSTCGGQGAGTRFLQMAGALRTDGADVVAASICDPGATQCISSGDCAAFPGANCVSGCGGALGSYCCNPDDTLAGTAGFGPILARIAEIVKPPSALLLPTQPADAAVTVLRITGADGSTRKICNGPAKPPLTFVDAKQQSYDWWFTATREQLTDADKAPSTASRYIYINQDTGSCVPNPGEGYSADYLGQVPTGGCTSDAYCTEALGDATPWTCFAGLDQLGVCIPPSPTAVGTCVCRARNETCPKG